MRQTIYLAVAAAALLNSGCLVIAAGAAAGGAATYAYCKGNVCQNYLANFEDTRAATHTALRELGMSIESEERQGPGGVIHTRTGNGERVRIGLDVTASSVPAAGPLTRVCVRVATFGDYTLSERIQYQVSAHLSVAPNPGEVASPAATMGPPQPLPAPPVPAETAPPPLLPPEPVKQR